MSTMMIPQRFARLGRGMGDVEFPTTRPRTVGTINTGGGTWDNVAQIINASLNSLNAYWATHPNTNAASIAAAQMAATSQQLSLLNQGNNYNNNGLTPSPGGINIFGTQVSYGTLVVVGLGIFLLQSRGFSRR